MGPEGLCDSSLTACPLGPSADEEDSGEDDTDVVSRTALKRQSQQLIESKTKRRTRYRKKEGKL